MASSQPIETFTSDSLNCSITGEIPKNPVIGSDGQIYEKEAIEKWLDAHHTSPHTREPMEIIDLNPSYILNNLCALARNGQLESCPDIRSIQKLAGRQGDISLSLEGGSSIKDLASIANIRSCPSAYRSGDFSDQLLITFSVDQNYSINNLSVGDLEWSDVVVMLDHSYSTSECVEAQDENGKQIEGGYTINDIIRHAAKTVAHAFKDTGSRVSFWKFDSKVTKIVDLTEVTDENLDNIVTTIDTIKPESATDIGNSIKSAISYLNERDDKSRNASILLLTDGQPTQSGAYSEDVAMVKKFKDLNVKYPVYTCGFGYNLKKKLMYNVAHESCAVNSHIPDGCFVATVFSNTIANILNTAAQNLTLHISSPDNSIDFGKAPNNFKSIINGCNSEVVVLPNGTVEHVILLGNIQFTQSRDIVINLRANKPNSKLEYYYSYEQCGETFVSNHTIITDYTNIPHIHPNAEFEFLRDYAIKQLELMVRDKERGLIPKPRYENLIRYSNNIENLEENSDCDKLIDTWTDQVNLAIVSDLEEHSQYWSRWGWIYIDQLRSAMINQVCNNFKDTVLQKFGGQLCKDTAENISDKFDTIPNTDATGHLYNSRSIYSSISSQTRSFNNSNPHPQPQPQPQPQSTYRSMASFNNYNNGCFTGDTTVQMANGTFQYTKNIRVGDKVLTMVDGIAKKAEITTVLKSVIPDGYTEIIELGRNCYSTPWHPVAPATANRCNSWEFACKIGNSKKFECDAVYCFAIKGGYCTIMGSGIGFCAATLGNNHGVGILAHPFWGTDAVIRAMQALPNYPMVTITPDMVIREGKEQTPGGKRDVSGFKPPKQ